MSGEMGDIALYSSMSLMSKNMLVSASVTESHSKAGGFRHSQKWSSGKTRVENVSASVPLVFSEM